MKKKIIDKKKVELRNETFKQFLSDLAYGAAKTNANTASFTARKCKTFQGGDVFIVWASKKATPFEVVEHVVGLLTDEV